MADVPGAAPSFDAGFLAAQRAKLEVEQQSLEGELARIARKDPVGEDYHARVPDVGRHEDENALEEEQYEAARSVEQSLELKLREVNAALERIAAGTYGTCAQCGSAVDRARLEALPSARACRAHAV